MTELTPHEIAAFRRALLRWYRREARDLPWRRRTDPYAIWISEIMLQQTRVDQAIPYYHRFMGAFPTVEALAQASGERVLKAWEGLGYYSRARHLHAAAQAVVREHDGVFPRTIEALTVLPGIGRYTAGAIASIAFGVRAPVLDGNVKRILSRVYDVETSIDDHGTTQTLWERADGLVPKASPGAFNQALMDLGATVCIPRAPRCGECPVRGQCRAFARGTQDERPVRRARKSVPRHELVGAAIAHEGRYLFGKRPPNGLLSGLWELPNGTVQPGETHGVALRRVVQEQLGVKVSVGGLLASVDHTYSHMKVKLTVYRCEIQGVPRPFAHVSLKWIAPAQFHRYPFPMVNRKFLHLLGE
jgi:A/G-specific adenine glycosylase